MRVIKSDNGKITECEYPRHDMGAIVGLKKGVQFYLIQEEKRPEYDSAWESLKQKEVILTDETDIENPHFKIAIKGWDAVPFTKEQVIQRLNDSLGQHLDGNYPLWKRQKHISELIAGVTGERLEYIERMKEWETNCRASRDVKESELLNNNKVPTLDWEPAPEK